MPFKFFKHDSANETLLPHSQNLFELHMEYVLLGELQVKNGMSYDLEIFHTWSQWTADQNGVGSFFTLSLYFFNYQMFFQKWTSANTFLPIFSNNKLEKEFWHRSVEILGKIMDPQKKFRINKTFESWSSQEINFSDIFASYFLLKRDSLKLFFKKANVITITAQKNEVFH